MTKLEPPSTVLLLEVDHYLETMLGEKCVMPERMQTPCYSIRVIVFQDAVVVTGIVFHAFHAIHAFGVCLWCLSLVFGVWSLPLVGMWVSLPRPFWFLGYCPIVGGTSILISTLPRYSSVLTPCLTCR